MRTVERRFKRENCAGDEIIVLRNRMMRFEWIVILCLRFDVHSFWRSDTTLILSRSKFNKLKD